MEEARDAEEKSSLEPTPNNMYVGGTPVSAAHHQHHTHTHTQTGCSEQGPAAGLEYKRLNR